jgi:cobalamin biosynthesis protein CobT
MQENEIFGVNMGIKPHFGVDLWYNPCMRNTLHTQKSALSGLARLLATENISVQHQPVATAMFDTASRTLTLPSWKDMPSYLYDMFVGHEVGHALFTPASFDDVKDAVRKVAPKDANTAKQYLNIVEDVRIERKMKEKFPGLRRDFVKGYSDLLNRDFFGVENIDINTLPLADRVNLHYKLGIMGHAHVQFNAEEQILVDEMEIADTWDQVVDLSARMYALSAQNEQPEPEEMPEMPDMGGIPQDGDSDDDDGEGEQQMMQQGAMPDDVDDWDDGSSDGDGEDESDEDGSGAARGEESDEDGEESGAGADDDTDDGESAESTDSADATTGTGNELPDNEPKAQKPMTDDSMQDRMEQEFNDKSARQRDYVTIPTSLKTEEFIVDYKEMAEMARKVHEHAEDLAPNWKEFQKTNRPIVSTMVKQFEMKQAADTSRRTSSGKTGRIDMSRLHEYKLTDDIFLRAASVREGKNHGLIMYIDWSGSMSNHMEATIHQLLNLTMFCRAINIPFEVYAFTSNTRHRADRWNSDQAENEKAYADYNQGDVVIQGFELHNWLSSRMRTTEYNELAALMLETATAMGSYRRSLGGLDLGGTPLDSALIAALDIIPAFQRKNNIQIVNLVVLTDGDATDHPCSRTFNGYNEDGRVTSDYKSNVVARFKNTDEYLEGHGRGHTAGLLNLIRKSTGAQVIGMFLADKKHIKRHVEYSVSDWDQRKVEVDKFKKNNFAILKKHGYDEYYMIPADQKVVSDTFENLGEDASPIKIRNAFIKGALAKKSSRTVLGRFAERVARGLGA